MYFDIEWFDK